MSELGVLEAVAALRERRVSAVELTEACFARIEGRNGGAPSFDGAPDAINAWARLYPELALTQARAADVRRAREGEGAPALCGVPVALKDIIGVVLATPLSATLTNATGYPWSALANPGGNLALSMGTNTSIFSGTAATAQFFALKNTTAAIVGTSQGSPVWANCGRAFHGSADVEDCMTLSELPGNGNDATIIASIGHTGTSTGDFSVALPGGYLDGTGGGNLIIGKHNTGGVYFENSSTLQITNGEIQTYFNIGTVRHGVAAEYANSDLTAQNAAKTATTLYAATYSGYYRVCWSADITTASDTSSTLGGTNGFQVLYTSPTDSVVKTTVPNTLQVSAGNTTGTATGDCTTVFAKTGTNIQYTYGYTDTHTSVQMAYELHITVEGL